MSLILPKRMAEDRVQQVLHDAEDVARRLREGDGTVGWRGDPTLELCFDHDSKRWCAVHRDREGKPYIAASSERCDASLLRKLANNDMETEDVFKRIRRENEALERAREKAFDDELSALTDKARWAIRRDIGWDTRGQHVGYRGGS